MRNKLLYPLLVALAFPLGVFGQESRYLEFQFNDDLETVLKRQLGNAAQIEELLNVLKKFSPETLKKFDIDPNSVQLKPGGTEITTSDPKLPDKLKQLLNGLPVKLSEQDQKAAQLAAERIRTATPPLKQPEPKSEVRQPQPETARPTRLPAPPKKEEQFNRATREWMKDLANSPLGGVLRNSRAWQRGLEELQRGTTFNGKASSLAFLERWTGKLGFPDGLKLEISDSLVSKLRHWTAPSLPRVNVNLPRIGGFSPSVNLPGIPGAATIPWEGVLVVGVLLAAAALLWQLLVHGPKRGGKRANGWRLGPWPVLPGKVSTPEQFIQAFEHLALLRLGLPARNWHHRRIAEGLQVEADATGTSAARRLMHLYEECRYAPIATWSNATLVSARRDLCLLAGVPAA